MTNYERSTCNKAIQSDYWIIIIEFRKKVNLGLPKTSKLVNLGLLYFINFKMKDLGQIYHQELHNYSKYIIIKIFEKIKLRILDLKF